MDYYELQDVLKDVETRAEIKKIADLPELEGHNFITPDTFGNYQLENGIKLEISTGRGFDEGSQIVGVTVVKDGEHDHDLSKSFEANANQILGYINFLKGL